VRNNCLCRVSGRFCRLSDARSGRKRPCRRAENSRNSLACNNLCATRDQGNCFPDPPGAVNKGKIAARESAYPFAENEAVTRRPRVVALGKKGGFPLHRRKVPAQSQIASAAENQGVLHTQPRNLEGKPGKPPRKWSNLGLGGPITVICGTSRGMCNHARERKCQELSYQ